MARDCAFKKIYIYSVVYFLMYSPQPYAIKNGRLLCVGIFFIVELYFHSLPQVPCYMILLRH